MANESKSDRLNLRVSPELRELFQVAADLENEHLTGFILGAARIRAEQTLADQGRFALPPERFEAFMDALERPPRNIPRLRKLMSEPTVLERRENASRSDSPDRADSPDDVR